MINLLTKEEKNNLNNEQRARQAVAFVSLLTILFSVGVVVSLSFFINLKIQRGDSPTNLSVENDSMPSLTAEENKLTESKIKRLTDLWPEENWSNIVIHFISNKPQVIKISQFAGVFDPKDKKMNLAITGNTDSRDQLVLFGDQLKTDDSFSKVDLPINNLLNEKGGQFSIKLEIKK